MQNLNIDKSQLKVDIKSKVQVEQRRTTKYQRYTNKTLNNEVLVAKKNNLKNP